MMLILRSLPLLGKNAQSDSRLSIYILHLLGGERDSWYWVLSQNLKTPFLRITSIKSLLTCYWPSLDPKFIKIILK